ncbi:hypothetical protein [Sphingorhabdus sp. SMR4y]|uniref:hypothetical protein n=1 Tax=Sphingorhabdus sp. SMR4y TaxID=2584094 RepID=UPI000B5C9033|nr:hypothetical protein [Sphingorhabdus sp. SMR4y]ASK88493.1 hypothetical protein SPHFLASMR4Y_01746 [Sphingorhabdus sp. SMR4y]
MTDTRIQAQVTQADRDAADEWTFIECMRCSEYEGDFGADLAADFAAHRIAALDGLNPDAIADVVEALREARATINEMARPSTGSKLKPSMEMWAECVAVEKRCRDALAKLEAQS